ncbi:MAG TPA: hypothetical protein VHP32_10485 [Ignavibacteria bacterium]|nr:hypothetical protein [Ignavibacteria bacterium]
METKKKDFLVRLINEPGPSGFEEKVQKIWKTEVSSFCRNIKGDVHGNLTATLNPDEEFSIMIVGHSDEIGLVINYVDDNGFIYFYSIGGVDASILGSQRARIITKNGIIEGVFGQKSLHQEDGGKRSVPKRYEVFIDIGAKSKAEVLKQVTIGDPVIFGNDYRDLRNNLAASRCFDNRIGIFIVAETLRKLSNKKFKTKVFGVSSVQEEINTGGAGNAAYYLNPTMAIAIDVMPATDYPGVSQTQFGDCKLGSGPVIRRGVRTNKRIADKMLEVAKKKKYKYQIDMDNGRFGTDSDYIAPIRSGIPVGGIEVATRYLHSCEEVLSLKDLDESVNYMTDLILEIDKDKNFLRKE